EEAIAAVRRRFGKSYPLVINGRKVTTAKQLESHNPANPSEIVGRFSLAGQAEAERAITAAAKAFETWRMVPGPDRAQYLFEAARVVRERRMEINAWMISEVGKNYLEADADTAEAIDFLEFYGREMLRLSGPQEVIPISGEKNYLEYIPLGVGAVIPPWNFPFAILVGMTSAALVTGNTVVLKPSSDSPMMGWLFVDILRQIGLPNGVVNFIPGNGSEIGDYIVDHPQIRFISFTGSASVGKRVYERASRTPDDQLWLKRVVAEMGGKDAIIVDAEADIDAAADGVAAAAFGFQGQKCSACSRAIVDAQVYDEFVEKLRRRVESLEVGEPTQNKPVGPVVSDRAFKSILEYIEIGKKEGKLITGGGAVSDTGYFIAPTVIANVKPNARIAQEEIFGPVLAVIKARNFDDALKIANNTKYGLTGALYSTNPEKLDRAAREFHVGNLYLNRKCTGALVGVHPFGGFNLSGTDSKAGGHDYLLLFLQGKSVAEKVGVRAKKSASAKKGSKKTAGTGAKSASTNGASTNGTAKRMTTGRRTTDAAAI
ncbi:MAG TPA: L-glutamate gamma-semialdehyde dehydrogenase, partial [Candidatus Kapabacteria bacterium]|nr:L-glutamate gamma-semialdehyde dehydrogenase [Candidatus Kapabacteria bacterium]